MPEIFLGMNVDDLKSRGALLTASEIAGQPDLWLKTYQKVIEKKHEIRGFLQKCHQKGHLDVILTGAGSSAFIGNAIAGPFQKQTGIRTRAVATTDLVTHAEQYFLRDTPTMLISFARSGNSPESIAAVDLANELCQEIYHLIISCNPKGALSRQCQAENCYVFLLPPEADDQSLAMTGSFTSMLLTCLLFSHIDDIERQKSQVDQLSTYGSKILETNRAQLQHMAEHSFERAVFLGSGPLQGIACESHLKLQELTDGHVICKYDSFLGFRHGPKAVINDQTLLVFLFSNNFHVHRYERDLVSAINAGERGLARIGVGENISQDLDLDLNISLHQSGPDLPEEYLAIVSILPAQVMGFYKSMALGLKPDAPSVSGTITRVVQGVTIYPFTKTV